MSLTHLSSGQNGRHFVDDIFRCIFENGNFCILIKISMKFVPKGPIDNNPALVEPMLTRFTDAYMEHWGRWVKCVVVITFMGLSSAIALMCMTHDSADYQSTLVPVVSWCLQATNHNLSQCWFRSMPPHGVDRPQWVKTSRHRYMWIKEHITVTSPKRHGISNRRQLDCLFKAVFGHT